MNSADIEREYMAACERLVAAEASFAAGDKVGYHANVPQAARSACVVVECALSRYLREHPLDAVRHDFAALGQPTLGSCMFIVSKRSLLDSDLRARLGDVLRVRNVAAHTPYAGSSDTVRDLVVTAFDLLSKFLGMRVQAVPSAPQRVVAPDVRADIGENRLGAPKRPVGRPRKGVSNPNNGTDASVSDQSLPDRVTRLRDIIAWAGAHDPDFRHINAHQAEVIGRYGKIFSREHLAELDSTTLYDFLLFRNNHHWGQMYRQSPRLIANIDRVRAALHILLDASKPISERFESSIAMAPGMGKGLASAILLVTAPHEYGVWNGTSEAALKALGLWPEFQWGSTPGMRYDALNRHLNWLAAEVDTDLWALDAVFWTIVKYRTDPTFPG